MKTDLRKEHSAHVLKLLKSCYTKIQLKIPQLSYGSAIAGPSCMSAPASAPCLDDTGFDVHFMEGLESNVFFYTLYVFVNFSSYIRCLLLEVNETWCNNSLPFSQAEEIFRLD